MFYNFFVLTVVIYDFSITDGLFYIFSSWLLFDGTCPDGVQQLN